MENTKDKRGAILQAALTLISEHGFHGTPMSKIAKDAGVSAGIIYHYFENKDDLIDELYRAAKADLGVAIIAGFDEAQPLREQLRRMWLNAVGYFVHHPQETTFIEQYMKSPFYRAEIHAEYHESYQLMIDTMERAQREQIIKNLPVMVIYSLTFDVASSLVQKQAAGLVELTDGIIEQVAEACWDAIRR
jgi:AcrR family transcriptional regulator